MFASKFIQKQGIIDKQTFLTFQTFAKAQKERKFRFMEIYLRSFKWNKKRGNIFALHFYFFCCKKSEAKWNGVLCWIIEIIEAFLFDWKLWRKHINAQEDSIFSFELLSILSDWMEQCEVKRSEKSLKVRANRITVKFISIVTVSVAIDNRFLIASKHVHVLICLLNSKYLTTFFFERTRERFHNTIIHHSSSSLLVVIFLWIFFSLLSSFFLLSDGILVVSPQQLVDIKKMNREKVTTTK